MDHQVFSRRHSRSDHDGDRLHSKNGLNSWYQIECANFSRRDGAKKISKNFFWSERNGRASYLNRLKCISNIPKLHKSKPARTGTALKTKISPLLGNRNAQDKVFENTQPYLVVAAAPSKMGRQWKCKPPNNLGDDIRVIREQEVLKGAKFVWTWSVWLWSKLMSENKTTL